MTQTSHTCVNIDAPRNRTPLPGGATWTRLGSARLTCPCQVTQRLSGSYRDIAIASDFASWWQCIAHFSCSENPCKPTPPEVREAQGNSKFANAGASHHGYGSAMRCKNPCDVHSRCRNTVRLTVLGKHCDGTMCDLASRIFSSQCITACIACYRPLSESGFSFGASCQRAV